MRITLCVITARPGGLDVLRAGLKEQTFDDFELVLVDAFHAQRRDQVRDYFARAGIRCVHTPCRLHNFPVDSCPQYRNAGLAKSSGELLIWGVDYTYFPPDCLEKHWRVWERSGGKVCGMGAHEYLEPPKTAYPLPDYAPIVAMPPNQEAGVTYQYKKAMGEAYAEAIHAGFYDPFWLSVFEEPLESGRQIMALRQDQHFLRADPKLSGNPGQVCPPNFFHAKNESVPLATAVAVNGFDEGYTGHLYDDTDFGMRLSNAGVRWTLLEAVATAQIVNPRHLFPHLIIQANPKDQVDRHYRAAREPEFTVAENPYSLTEMRTMGTWWWS